MSTHPAESARDVRVVGIAGGGQLAQMMLPAARQLGLEVVVLDPEPRCSAAVAASHVVVGAFDSLEALRDLAARCDVITFEIERISTSALRALERDGHVVRPRAAVLEVIQDKLAQKRFLARHGIATSAFVPCELPGTLPWSLPCVWKARRDGYDGRGVAVLRSAADTAGLPAGAAMLEEFVDIDYELAIMVARGVGGDVVHYPLTEIVMDPQAHVMDTVVAPAVAPATVAAQCADLATAIVSALDYVGILAVEFFVDRQGQVLVNEISPRPHNSGHYTIEACATSQFEQHQRAVCGRDLGDAALRCPAVTFNVLGAAGAYGTPRYVGFDAFMDDADVHVHCYDKPQVRPGRKMAHVTVLAPTRDAALARAAEVRALIRVEGNND